MTQGAGPRRRGLEGGLPREEEQAKPNQGRRRGRARAAALGAREELPSREGGAGGRDWPEEEESQGIFRWWGDKRDEGGGRRRLQDWGCRV